MGEEKAKTKAKYWNDVHASTTPPPLPISIGFLLAASLPMIFFTLCDTTGAFRLREDTAVARIEMFCKLQIINAVTYFLIINVPAFIRVASSSAAAHDPVVAVAAGLQTIQWRTAERVAVNTTEQLLVMVLASAALAMRIEARLFDCIPAWYLTFLVSRIVYAVGYVCSGHWRMMGFPATIFPNIAGTIYTGYLIWEHGF